MNQDVGMIRWLMSKFGSLAQSAETIHLFNHACACGELEIAKWYVKTFAMIRSDVVGDHNWAFMDACKNGHLNIIEWMTEEFEITNEEAMVGEYQAYRLAKHRGYTEIVNYLTKVFGGL
jgi:hypothetical protein